nr:terpene synthase [Ficus erecta]
MALHLFPSINLFNFTTKLQTSKAHVSTGRTSSRFAACKASSVANQKTDNIARKSGNYSPTIWNFDYIQSLKSDYGGETNVKRNNKLKEELRMMLEKETNLLAQLELIDALQRLGVSYHFEEEINNLLKGIYMMSKNPGNGTWQENNLHATALEFRLLRQYGYWVNQETFNTFKDETGDFKACLGHDTMGLLSLYEASFHLIKNESVLEEARQFTTKNLEEYTRRNKEQQNYVSKLVGHALELPLHWRLPRWEARWFIDAYETRPDMNPTLLEFAKLDFNIVQSMHQEDLKHASRWWNEDTGFPQKLAFARDRLTECFFWGVGMTSEPNFEYSRRVSTKVLSLVTTIDDVYDVFGTLDELELFTNVVEIWDLNAVDQLPDYMKICFYALNNFVNEIAFDVLKEQPLLITNKYLTKVWTDLCKSFLLEAKWYHTGYKPTLQEYIENAWISVSSHVILMHAYISITNPMTEVDLKFLETYPSIIRNSAMILRFTDDQGTSTDELKRGDVPKSIQCYMHETGASEDEARRHIKVLIEEAWEQLNKDRLENSTLSRAFIEVCTNLARIGVCLYQYGDDGHAGVQEGESKNRILSLLVNPIAL